jgi:hypothetical protein
MTDWRKKIEPTEGVETYIITHDGRPYLPASGFRLVAEGKVTFEWRAGEPVIGSHNNCHKALMHLQGHSNDYAAQYGGWAIVPYVEKSDPADGNDTQP